MNVFSRHKNQPADRLGGGVGGADGGAVSNKVGLEADGQNFLLMHAMGPERGGVIGSAIAAG